MTRGRRIVLALWDGGGTVPPLMRVARRLVERGHAVRVVADPTVEPEATAAGCSFGPWREAPHRTTRDRSADILRDYAAKSRMKYMKEELGGYFFAPGRAWTSDLLSAIDAHGAEVVLTDAMLVWGVLAAEARGLPSAALFSMPYYLPEPAMTPPGAAMLRVPRWLRGPRDAFLRWITDRMFDMFLSHVNGVRVGHRLPPLRHTLDQVRRADARIVLTSRAFDHDGAGAPPGVCWAGPQLDDPTWVEPWTAPWPADDRRPLVVVGLSSTFQDHAALTQRLVDALADLPVRGLVTLGPALRDGEVIGRGDVVVRRSVPHDVVLRGAALLVTHAGHGTALKGLSHGVPMLCIPMGRDQDDNAARIAALGAGLTLRPKASVEELRAAIRRMLDTPSYGEAARRVSATIARAEGERDAVEVIEELAARGTPAADARIATPAASPGPLAP